jgi:ABC-2 type transport system ATP-binding protein
VLTTHYMDEARTLADDIAVLAAGEIVARGTAETIGGRDTALARIRFARPDDVAPLPLEPTTVDYTTVTFETEDPTPVLHRPCTEQAWSVSDNAVTIAPCRDALQ